MKTLKNETTAERKALARALFERAAEHCEKMGLRVRLRLSNGPTKFDINRILFDALMVLLLCAVVGCASRKSTTWPDVFRLPKPETRQAVPARAMAPPPSHQPLSWKFHEEMPVSNVEFTIFGGPTPTGPWTALTTVDASPVVVPTPGQQGFFTVESHWRGLKATLR